MSYESLLEQQNKSGKAAASNEDWNNAWKQKQQEQFNNNVRKEDHSDPTPLLVDKISSLPPNSARRKSAEILKSTIDNTTSNVGGGLDTMTRESYKEVKRLVKHSDMLQYGTKEPLPGPDQIVGEEQGTKVSNIQSWQAPFANAVKPISDALGSHSDTSSSVAKSQTGPEQLLPTACSHAVDGITPNFTNEIDTSLKAVNVDAMQHLPSRMVGSLRQLTTAADPALSVPFEIASDCYNGLLGVMNNISSLTDGVMATITSFVISPIGGLIDGIFPAGQLDGIIKPIMSIASKVEGLNQLLGGFSAITNISNAIGGIASSLSSILSNPLKLAAMLASGADVASIVGGLAGKSVGCAGDQLGMGGPLANASAVLNNATSTIMAIGNTLATVAAGGVMSSTNNLNGGLGNLGAVLGGGINGALGSLTSNLRVPSQIIAGILPPELTSVMKKLDQLPSLGMVGNLGFSVGASMDSIRDNSYSKCMSKYATHSAIVSPMFNKECNPTGAYAQETSLGLFNGSPFVKGAQGNKGVTGIGPGGTASQKVFGLS